MNKSLLIVVLVIVLAIIGYIIYDQYSKKEDSLELDSLDGTEPPKTSLFSGLFSFTPKDKTEKKAEKAFKKAVKKEAKAEKKAERQLKKSQ